MQVYSEQTTEIETRAIQIWRGLTGHSNSDATWMNEEDFEHLEHSYDKMVPLFFR